MAVEVPWVQAVPAAALPSDAHGQLPGTALGPTTACTSSSAGFRKKGLETEAEEDAVKNSGLALLWSLASDVCSTLHLTCCS